MCGCMFLTASSTRRPLSPGPDRGRGGRVHPAAGEPGDPRDRARAGRADGGVRVRGADGELPVGAGTSGHLLGGALAAALVGPWTAVLVMSMVLLVQGLLFTDGGLTALGTNITLIGLITVLVGYVLTRTLLQVLPRRMGSLVPAATVGALFS